MSVQHNLALVAQCIAAGEPVSRAGIAAATGLTKTTVSSLVDDLVGAGLVTELGPEASGRIGRPASALALNRSRFVGAGLAVAVPGPVETDRGLVRLAPNLGWSVAELLARARAGDPETLRAVASAGRALGLAISATVNVVDPGTVVLGGLYASLEPWLREPLLAELSERAITQRWSPARVLASRLGPNAAVRGATGAVVRRVLADPSAVFAAAGHRVAPTRPRTG